MSLIGSLFAFESINNISGGLHCIFVCFWVALADSSLDILAIGEKGIAESLGHKQVTAKDASERGAFDLVYTMDEVILAVNRKTDG